MKPAENLKMKRVNFSYDVLTGSVGNLRSFSIVKVTKSSAFLLKILISDYFFSVKDKTKMFLQCRLGMLGLY